MLTKDDLQQIGKIVKGEIDPIKKDLQDVKQSQAHTNTALEAVKAGQDDIRDKMASEAGVMDLGAKVEKITRNHERRIEELEKKADLPNPYKN
jgi:hypothetical protein